MKAKLKQEAELKQEAIDNKVFSKAVKVNAVALSAVKSFLEVSKVLGVHRSTIISWRNNISLADYNKYNQTGVTPEIALKRPMQNENYFLNICLFDCDILSKRYHNYNLHDLKEMESLRIILSSSRDRNFAWFREETGNKHWVLYDTEMFEVRKIKNGPRFLRYKDECTLAPEIPINASSCVFMFAFDKDRTRIDLAKLNTEGIVDMQAMFAFCPNLKYLDTSMLKTDSALNTIDMFKGCRSLAKLDLRNAAMFGVKKTRGMFASCVSLEKIVVSKRFNTSKVLDSYNMFSNCCSLPNYRKGIMAQVLMVKPVKNGSYLTYVTNSITARQRKLLSD